MKKIFIPAIVVLLNGCYYDNLDEIHPDFNVQCDTTGTMSFASDIVPILSSGCGSTDNSCHHTDNSDSDIGLDTYEDVKTQIENDNQFLKSIVHDPAVTPMPQGGGSLDECSILKIESWINNGYADN